MDKQIKEIFTDFNYKIKEQEIYYENDMVIQEKFTENCINILNEAVEKVKLLIK